MIFSDLFKVMIIQCQITWKWYNIQLYLQWPTNRKSYMIYWTAPFSMTLNHPYPQFWGYAILWRWISQKRYDIQTQCHWNTSDLHTPYATVSFRMTLSDLAKYLMTRSVARSLCDSWASCLSISDAVARVTVTAMKRSSTADECVSDRMSCISDGSYYLVHFVHLWEWWSLKCVMQEQYCSRLMVLELWVLYAQFVYVTLTIAVNGVVFGCWCLLKCYDVCHHCSSAGKWLENIQNRPAVLLHSPDGSIMHWHWQ